MDTVFVKKGSSKSYTNLIPSSAPIPLKKLSKEPIGQQEQQQQPLGINNVETQTSHRRKKTLQLECAVVWVLLLNPLYISAKHKHKRRLSPGVFIYNTLRQVSPKVSRVSA